MDEGDKVRVVIKFAGRQLKHTELSKRILEAVISGIPEAVIESQPVFAGRNLSMIINKPQQR